MVAEDAANESRDSAERIEEFRKSLYNKVSSENVKSEYKIWTKFLIKYDVLLKNRPHLKYYIIFELLSNRGKVRDPTSEFKGARLT